MSNQCSDFSIWSKQLSKQYSKQHSSGTFAVKNLDLKIPRHSIYTVVGPNGAGKTTTLRMLGTQLLPTSGTATILGYDLVCEASLIRQHIASVPQEASVYPELSAWDHVYYYLVARGNSFRQARIDAERSLRSLGMWDVRKTLSDQLSGGFRHRILITMAFASGATVLFLDEPTAGLDPIARREFWNTMHDLRTTTTIVVTTHLMEEAEILSDYVLIINGGVQVAFGTPSELKETVASADKVIFDMEVDRSILASFGQVADYAGRVLVYPDSQKSLKDMMQWAIDHKISFSVKPISLDDVFVKCIEGTNETFV